MLTCTHLEIVSKSQLHDVKVITILLEHRLNGISHSTFVRHPHDLGHLVGQVHFKNISLVSLKDIQVLCVGGVGWGGGGVRQ